MKLKTEYNGINLKRRLWHFKFPIFGISPYKAVADLRGAPYSPKFSQFHAEFWKFWQNRMLAPPGGLTPTLTGNPGSAPAKIENFASRVPNPLRSPLQIFQKPRVPKGLQKKSNVRLSDTVTPIRQCDLSESGHQTNIYQDWPYDSFLTRKHFHVCCLIGSNQRYLAQSPGNAHVINISMYHFLACQKS